MKKKIVIVKKPQATEPAGPREELKKDEPIPESVFSQPEEQQKRKLNPRQELFCRTYILDPDFFGNGTKAYIEVYKPKKTPGWYDRARSCASQLLTNMNVLVRINELMEQVVGLNDAHADKQLYFLMTQNTHLIAKEKAVKQYNELKKRVTRRLDLSGEIKADLEISNDKFRKVAKLVAETEDDDHDEG